MSAVQNDAIRIIDVNDALEADQTKQRAPRIVRVVGLASIAAKVILATDSLSEPILHEKIDISSRKLGDLRG